MDLKFGSIYLLCNQKEETKIFQGQAFTQIQFPNEQGSYVNGDCFWIEANLLKIGTMDDLMPSVNVDRGSSNNKVVILSFGTQNFTLMNIGDETPWLQFPDCTDFGYKISSADYGYEIVFSDGSSYPGSATDEIPFKEHPSFKVRATKLNQIVTITVWQK